jgi:hypothetical protein
MLWKSNLKSLLTRVSRRLEGQEEQIPDCLISMDAHQQKVTQLPCTFQSLQLPLPHLLNQ